MTCDRSVGFSGYSGFLHQLSKLFRNEGGTGQTGHQNLTVTELGRDETFNLL